MSIRQTDLPEHTRFGFTIRDPKPEVEENQYKPDPVCQCGCGKTIETVEFRTHEDEPLASEACWTRISYKEGWIRKEAV